MVTLISKKQKQQNKRIKWVIKGIDYDKINEWEEEFLESIEEQSDKGNVLTSKQMGILERIGGKASQ